MTYHWLVLLAYHWLVLKTYHWLGLMTYHWLVTTTVIVTYTVGDMFLVATSCGNKCFIKCVLY